MAEREAPAATAAAAGRRGHALANISYLAASNVLAKVFSFAFIIYANHALGPGLMGDYNVVLGFVGLFGVMSDLGLSTLAVRDVSEDRARGARYISNIIVIRTLVTIVSIVLIVVLAQAVIYPALRPAVYICAAALIPLTLSNTLGLVFQYSERLAYSGLLTVGATAAQAILGMAVIYTGRRVLALVIVYSMVTLASALATAWIVYRRFLPRRFEFDLRWWRTLVSSAMPFTVLSLTNVLYNYADRQILLILGGCTHMPLCRPVGEYTAAYRPLDILTAVLIGGVNAAILPAFTRAAAESPTALARIARSACAIAVAVGAPAALFVTVYAPEVLRVVGGRQFLEAAPSAAILIWTFPCILVLTMLYNALYALHRQVIVSRAFAVTLVFNVVLNVLLIPRFSYFASAAITVASELVNAVIVVMALRRSLGALGLAAPVAKMAAILAVTALPLWALRAVFHEYSIVAGVPLGLALVVLGLRVTRLLGANERTALARMPVLGRYATLL